MAGTAPPNDWPTRKDVALKLGITFNGVRHLEKRQELTPHKTADDHGRELIRYDPAEVDALIAAKKRKREQPADADEAFGQEFGDTLGPQGQPTTMKEIGASQVVAAMTGAMRQAQGHVGLLVEKLTIMMTNLSDSTTKVLASLSAENVALRGRCSDLETKQWGIMDMFQQNLVIQREHAEEEARAAHSRKMKEEAFDRLMTYAPLIGAMFLSKTAAGAPAKEMALTNIVERMDADAIDKLVKSGALDQASLATVLAIKDRLNNERIERLKKQAEELEKEEERKRRQGGPAGADGAAPPETPAQAA